MGADQENRTKEGQGFYKLDETSMTVVQDELSGDFYDLTTQHTTEITKLLKEYDDHQIKLILELESYEKERRQKEGDQKETEAGDKGT